MGPSNTKPPEKPQVPLSLTPKGLMALSGKEALDAILESITPGHLIQSLAEEDFFRLVQDIGPADALPALARATNNQWQYLLDQELWQRDRLEFDTLKNWFALLLKADPDRLLIWGLGEQTELLQLYLARYIAVRIREEDESPSDFEDGYFSVDDVFYVRVLDDKHDETIRNLLQRLAALDVSR